MPNRIIRDGINSSSRINALSHGAEILYRRLMSVVDDFGRFYAAAATVRGACWPCNPEKVTEAEVETWIGQCSQGPRPLLFLYEVEGCKYIEICGFGQQIRTKSKFPEPPNSDLISDGYQNVGTRRSSESETKAKAEDNTSPRGEEHWPSVRSLVKLYNEKTPKEFPSVNEISPARIKKAKQYLAAFPKLEFWEGAFANCHHSKFLRGLAKNGTGHENFKADFDWLLTKGRDGTENLVKVAEGKYGD